jgi:hypothetical protein
MVDQPAPVGTSRRTTLDTPVRPRPANEAPAQLGTAGGVTHQRSGLDECTE